jgi:hypothetical protein
MGRAPGRILHGAEWYEKPPSILPHSPFAPGLFFNAKGPRGRVAGSTRNSNQNPPGHSTSFTRPGIAFRLEEYARDAEVTAGRAFFPPVQHERLAWLGTPRGPLVSVAQQREVKDALAKRK